MIIVEDKLVSYIPNWANIKIFGDDVVSFLQGQTSNDVNLKIYQGQFSTILDAKAKVLAFLFIYRISQTEYFILAPNRTNQWLINHLDKFIIMEDIKLLAGDYQVYLFNGIGARDQLKNYYKDLAIMATFEGVKIADDYLCHSSFIGDDGYLIFSHKKPSFIKEQISQAQFDCYRLERGIAFWGQEYDDNNLLPETGLQAQVVNYEKGCFIGQEIVARVKSRGSVNRLLSGLLIEEGKIKLGDLTISGQKVGKVVNFTYSPSLGKEIAYAYLNKNTRQKQGLIEMQQQEIIIVSIHRLPFITDERLQEDAEKLFKQAMKLFSEKSREKEDQAIALLRQAIMKAPKYADAYEALGVILSRHQKYDEAINLMNQLKELNPSEVMAYSNLSIFYMKKGMIDEAEEEKAQATLVTFKNAASQRKQRLSKKNQLTNDKQQITIKIAMFEQVLQLDDGDLLANYSLGKSYFDLDQFEKAIGYLEKAIMVKANYSVAYLYLGKTFMALKKNDQARVILTKGIAVANDNGDLMPAKEMLSLLRNLTD